MGNSRARAVYEANLPDNFRRPQTDSALESFIRAKYEHNKYTAREWVPPRLPKVGPPRALAGLVEGAPSQDVETHCPVTSAIWLAVVRGDLDHMQEREGPRGPYPPSLFG